MRLTKIVCTLGPSSQTKEDLLALADAGMAIARINMSHGDKDQYTSLIETIREINNDRNVPIGILLDTKGAEIRTGVVEHPIAIEAGQEVVFTHIPNLEDSRTVISVNYDAFAKDVLETDKILLDNGELSFEIIETRKDGSVVAKANQSGGIGSRRHINLPGADVDLPSITDKDWEDIAFAVEQEVDFLALSFIRTEEEVQEVQKYLDEHKSTIKIITKIETAQAVKNIAQIIESSAGIMVARGDLGAEIEFETLPAIQDEITMRCSDAGKPVIVATHMLESMKEHPIPTRAEMTDVAHAAYTQADATMLSGETASGKHPRVAVNAMHKLLESTEKYISRFTTRKQMHIHSDLESQCEAAVTMAGNNKADAIMVFTKTGKTALAVSKFRPHIPIIACCTSADSQGKMTNIFGVFPLLIPFTESDETVSAGIQKAKDSGLIHSGQKIVLIADTSTENAPVSSIQTREV